MQIRTAVAIAATIITWASAFTAQAVALGVYPPGPLALFRFLVASVALALVALVTRMRLPRVQDVPAVLVSGLFGVFLYHLAIYYGQLTITAGSTSFLSNTSPIFTVLLATLLLDERLSVLGWAGIGIGFVGSVFIAIGETEGLRLDRGAFLVLTGALLWSLWFVVLKHYLKRYTPIEFTTYTVWAGTLFLLVFVPGLAQPLWSAPLSATASVVYLGIFPSAIGYVTWAYVLADIPVSRAAGFLYLIPPLAIVIAWVWLSEMPGLLSILGGVTILVGVGMVNVTRSARIRNRPHESDR